MARCNRKGTNYKRHQYRDQVVGPGRVSTICKACGKLGFRKTGFAVFDALLKMSLNDV